jgi:hypothetical protein
MVMPMMNMGKVRVDVFDRFVHVGMGMRLSFITRPTSSRSRLLPIAIGRYHGHAARLKCGLSTAGEIAGTPASNHDPSYGA